MISSTSSTGSGRGWGHTHADTLDKIDVRDLREHAVTIADAVCALAGDRIKVASRSRDDTRALVDEGYEQELRLGGRWPY